MIVLLVAAYLAAIVVANLTTSAWGPEWSIYNAFLFIGLTLTTRDKLHDLWGRHRFRNMALLILTGSAIAYVASLWLAPDAIPSDVVARIALASAVAFLVAETMDAIGYQRLLDRPWMERVNLSNLIGATFDSIVFVAIAFGPTGAPLEWAWEIIFLQFCAKVAGGVVFAALLEDRRERRRGVAIA